MPLFQYLFTDSRFFFQVERAASFGFEDFIAGRIRLDDETFANDFL
jgi:hypothetical protein